MTDYIQLNILQRVHTESLPNRLKLIRFNAKEILSLTWYCFLFIVIALKNNGIQQLKTDCAPNPRSFMDG